MALPVMETKTLPVIELSRVNPSRYTRKVARVILYWHGNEGHCIDSNGNENFTSD